MAVVNGERKLASSLLKLAATATLPVAVWLYKDFKKHESELDDSVLKIVRCIDDICSLRFTNWDQEKNK